MIKIDTESGPYIFEELKFKRGKEVKINPEIARENLLIFQQVLANANIPFGLIYGTLLGAIREHNFIAHDEDVDVFILDEYRTNVLNSLFEFAKKGFKVGRFKENQLLSLVRNDEYIDVYFFRKIAFGKRKCDGYVLKSKFLEQTKNYSFLGINVSIPSNAEALLVNLYGKDWRIPKKGSPASNYGTYLTIRNYIRKHHKKTYEFVKMLKQRIKNILAFK